MEIVDWIHVAPYWDQRPFELLKMRGIYVD